MSRSALVTTRWSKTKPPLSAPATRRSAGSHRRRSGCVEHLLLAVLGRHRGGYPQPQRVEVAIERVGLALRRLAAPRAGERRRSRGARRAGCLRRSARCHAAGAPAAPPRGPGPSRIARSGRPGSASPSSAGGRSRSLRPGSGWPPAARLPGAAHPAGVSTGVRGIRRPIVLIGLVDRGDSERRGRTEAGVDDRRDEDRKLATVGAGDRCPGVDRRHCRGVAGAALPTAGAHLRPARLRTPGSPRPTPRSLGGAARAARSAPRRSSPGGG